MRSFAALCVTLSMEYVTSNAWLERRLRAAPLPASCERWETPWLGCRPCDRRWIEPEPRDRITAKLCWTDMRPCGMAARIYVRRSEVPSSRGRQLQSETSPAFARALTALSTSGELFAMVV